MDALDLLVAKEEIRELVRLYSRGIDRKDIALLRTLYTEDAIDDHGPYYSGPADGYLAFIEQAVPHMHIGSHFVCNHQVSVEGDEGEGEVYAFAWHLTPDGKGGLTHDMQGVRYIDRYRREDGRWKFAKRVLAVDMKLNLPAGDHGPKPDPEQDPSYRELVHRAFARGGRA